MYAPLYSDCLLKSHTRTIFFIISNYFGIIINALVTLPYLITYLHTHGSV